MSVATVQSIPFSSLTIYESEPKGLTEEELEDLQPPTLPIVALARIANKIHGASSGEARYIAEQTNAIEWAEKSASAEGMKNSHLRAAGIRVIQTLFEKGVYKEVPIDLGLSAQFDLFERVREKGAAFIEALFQRGQGFSDAIQEVEETLAFGNQAVTAVKENWRAHLTGKLHEVIQSLDLMDRLVSYGQEVDRVKKCAVLIEEFFASKLGDKINHLNVKIGEYERDVANFPEVVKLESVEPVFRPKLGLAPLLCGYLLG